MISPPYVGIFLKASFIWARKEANGAAHTLAKWTLSCKFDGQIPFVMCTQSVVAVLARNLLYFV